MKNLVKESMDEYLILTLDSTDEFVDEAGDSNLYAVDGPMDYTQAKKIYDEIHGSISNVFLVKVEESELFI